MTEWKDIGEQLSAAREAKSLELKEISKATRIPEATLEALEKSDYSIFPNPTYARSFLSQYSEYLGVDADEWVDSFETGDVLAHGAERNQFTQTTSSPAERSQTTQVDRSALLQTITVIIITVSLIIGGYYLYKKIENSLGGQPTQQL